MGAQPSPGSYPGNASLPREVKEKILSTFRHTLNLFSEGKLEDCLIGCDFILKMDARFAPARQLMEKARNPNADIDVSQLEAIVATTPTRQERVAGADVDRLLVRAVESFNARDFDAAIAAAEQVLAVTPGSPDALEILDKSEQKKAAEPVFDGCRRRALAALEANRPADARRELEQMRGLDPDHPAVALLERRIGAAAPAAGSTAPKPPPPPDFGGLSLDLPDTGSGVGGGFATEEPSIGFEEGKDAAWNAPSQPRAAAPPPPAAAAPGGGGLDALSLDSLSLDLPASVEPMTPPSSGRRTELGGPLHDSRPAIPPGSPADMWGDSGGGLNLGDVDFGPRADSPGVGESAPSVPTAIPGLGPDPQEESDAGEQEIAALLRQGDDAAARGDRQQAIEIWSRIFLIDINNTEAVTRIENTRQHMADGNRRISDSLTSGREAYEMGDLPGARELFQQVLGVDPHEPTARFYLDRIQEDMSRPSAAGGSEAPPVPLGSATAPSAVPAEPDAPSPPPERKPFRLPVHPRVLIVVAAFVAITLALAYVFVFRAPRPAAPGPAAKAASAGSLPRARQLLGEGKIDEARQELKDIPPSSRDYAQAQRTLADLGKPPAAAAAPKAGGGVSVLPQTNAGTSAPPTDAQADAARIRLVAERALAEKRYIEALKNFSQASLAFRNDPTFAQSMGVAAEKVTALTPAVKLYNEREYETAIPVLWRIFQEDRENQDAKTYLLRAYYNQGITQLQNGQYPKAIQSFQEALSLDPADAEAIRHRKFAERYQKGDLDLMGRIYVRHLNHRP